MNTVWRRRVSSLLLSYWVLLIISWPLILREPQLSKRRAARLKLIIGYMCEMNILTTVTKDDLRRSLVWFRGIRVHFSHIVSVSAAHSGLGRVVARHKGKGKTGRNAASICCSALLCLSCTDIITSPHLSPSLLSSLHPFHQLIQK